LLAEESTGSLAPIELRDGVVRMLDQTLLPAEVRYIETAAWRDVEVAIRRLAVRGAPLIGIAAAYALALAARAGDDVAAAARALAATRPTAVNLHWALDRMLAAAGRGGGLEAEARRIHQEQIEADLRMGEAGAAFIADGDTLLTHCNTGALATGGIGTALGAVTTAHRQGKRLRVFVDETRPLLQGARLTAWELAREGIAHDIIVDAAAAGMIARGRIRSVFVGADRIAANGDVANKVGTYALALAAQAHAVPFYVVAPVSTIDPATRSGSDIDIEERSGEEVLSLASNRVAPESSSALNPAFDVTPAALLTAIVTEQGVLRAPFAGAIAGVTRPAAVAR